MRISTCEQQKSGSLSRSMCKRTQRDSNPQHSLTAFAHRYLRCNVSLQILRISVLIMIADKFLVVFPFHTVLLPKLGSF